MSIFIVEHCRITSYVFFSNYLTIFVVSKLCSFTINLSKRVGPVSSEYFLTFRPSNSFNFCVSKSPVIMAQCVNIDMLSTVALI